MDVDDPYQVETARLAQTHEEIERQLSNIGPRYYGDDFVEQLLDAKREETRNRLELLSGEPYFGRLDFVEQGKPDPQPLYIGKRGMNRQSSSEPYVIDWRAPVASLFYTFTGGDDPVSYEAPEGAIQGDVHLKRNLSIRDKALQRVVDSYVRGGDNLGLSDEFLLYRLGEKKDNRLRDIVSTIQAEQDRIIRAPRGKALIIQGAAGSGKTTVALHRLAYLLYEYQDVIRAERMIIFAPNTMFLDYISGVLPELGVGNVRQSTFAQWAVDLLGEAAIIIEKNEAKRWFSTADSRPPIDEETPERFKGSLVFKNRIDAKLRLFEETYMRIEDFAPWDGKVLSAQEIREWWDTEYRDYPLAPRRERLAARLGRWLEMRLNEIGDPRLRKDRSKTGKQRLRAFVKKLPVLHALTFYRSLFERESESADGVPAAVAEETRRYLNKGIVQSEDLAALVWIHAYFNGTSGQTFDHVVVDEAQDASPFQIALLNRYMREPSFTILGDLAQGIHAYRGIQRWDEFTAVFDKDSGSYHELRQSYRSTLEIIDFANGILPFTDTALPPAIPVFRSGDPVEIRRIEAEQERLQFTLDFIRENRERGMGTIAVIGRTEQECLDIHRLLNEQGVLAHAITEGQNEYKGGVSVVPVYLAKGLEFDGVLLLDVDRQRYTDTPQDAKLLYVGCTRALHRLTLTYTGEASPLLAHEPLTLK